MSIKQPLNSICHAIQRYIEETKTPAYYQPSPGGSLEDTIACGCKLCLVALRASGYQGRIDEIHDPEDEPFIHADVCVSATNNPSYNVIPVSTPIPASTSPEATIDRVADWLKTCLLNHSPLCPGAPTPSTVSTLPRRVLHVGTPSNPRVRLATPAPGEKGLYICLSHCWGGHQPLRTTLEPDTLTQFRSKIDWEDLPRTFQDAVLYTRALGIEYLWIDSLCIIQDSTEDWLVQSRAMASIYQNAILTLAATASVGPHDGLFRTSRTEHMATPLELAPSMQHPSCDMPDHASAPNIENGGCCLENEAEHVQVYARTPLPHLQSPHPLLKRAWVLQERLLSPRILHFLADELAWECMGALECLCSALSISKATTSLPPDSPLAPVFRSHTAGHSGGADVVPPWVFRKTRMHAPSFEYMAPAAVTDAWHELVEEYSAMRLSFGEDVFPAIGGGAGGVRGGVGGAREKGVYVAGLWRDSFGYDLLWLRADNRVMQRVSVWRAPSFSWASVGAVGGREGGVSYKLDKVFRKDDKRPGTKINVIAQVVETRVEPVSGGDDLGRLRSGYVVLRGMLVVARLVWTERAIWDVIPMGKEKLGGFFHEDFDLKGEWTDCAGTESGTNRGIGVYCLALIEKVRAYYKQKVWMVLRVKDETVDEKLFERIGLFRHFADDGKDPEWAIDEDHFYRETTVKII